RPTASARKEQGRKGRRWWNFFLGSVKAMGLSSNCAKTIKVQQCVKLPDSKYLHINDELAGCFGTEDHGDGQTALVLSPFGKNAWPVKVDRDAKGAFLGDGWPQFVAAHGIGVGWYLVIRHEGCGVLTLKAFNASFVIKEFGLTITVLSPAEIENAFARKPQFIVPLQRSFMEKMPIPPEFLQRGYISEEDLNRPRPIATFLTSWHIELKKDGPNVFFTGSEWPKFLAYFEIAETDVLLIKYQGCMNFSFETFQNGNNEDIEEKISSSQQSEQSPAAQCQEDEHVSTRRRTHSNGITPGAQSQEEEHVSTRTRKQSNGKTPGAQSEEEEPVSTQKRKQSNGKTPGAQSQEEEHVSTPKTPKRKRSKSERMVESPTTSGHLNKKTKCVYELGSAGSQAWLRKTISSGSVLKKCVSTIIILLHEQIRNLFEKKKRVRNTSAPFGNKGTKQSI
uniref:TF-B3 domain-containing protein n=1 Tax=Aegilops tauschii subsp. strangulata TaxID=200361 RepID=A0A453MAI5_AEGTS